jgi:hypothetical protein
MEELEMLNTTAANTTDLPKGGIFPEEEAILARFLTRVRGGARRTVDGLSRGSFLVL